MGFFKKNIQAQALSPIEQAAANFKTARTDLLIVVIATLVNIVLVLTGSGSYFLFSASIPYYLTVYGMLFTGKLPPEYYTGDLAGMTFIDEKWLIVMLALAFIILALYAVCFFMLRKPNKVWFIVALVAFCIDSVAMLFLINFDSSALIDVIFHALIIYYLIKGIRACSVISKFEKEMANRPVIDQEQGENPSSVETNPFE